MAPPRGERPTRRKESARPPLSPPRSSPTMATVENPPAPPVLEPVQPSPELVPSPPREGLIPMPIGAMGIPGPPPMAVAGGVGQYSPHYGVPGPYPPFAAMPASLVTNPPPPDTIFQGTVTNFGHFPKDGTASRHCYGFIKVDHTHNEVFVSEQDAPDGYLSQGDRCEFRIVDARTNNRRTGAKQWKATDVVCIQRVTPIPEQRPRRLSRVSPPQSQPDKVKGTLLPPGAFAPLLLDACGCGAHAALLEKAQIDDDILFDTITFEDLQAAGLPSLDARRVIARLEQLKAPSKSLEHSFPPLSNGTVAPPVKEAAGWSQVAKPVVPEAVVPEALPEEPPVIIEAPAPAPAPSPPEQRKKRPAKKKEEAPVAPEPEPVAPELSPEEIQFNRDMAEATKASQESSWSSVVKKDRKGRKAAREKPVLNGKKPYETFSLEINGSNALEGCRLYKDSIDEDLEQRLVDTVDDMLARDARGTLGGQPFQGGRPRKLKQGQSRTDVQAGPKFDDYKHQQILTEGDTLADGSLFAPEPMPAVARELHDALIRRGVLSEDAPFADIFLANVYERGQFTLNHIDAKYIKRPLIVTSLLSSGTMVFGKKLARDQEKNGSRFFGKNGSGTKQIRLPPRSTLVP